MASGDHSPMNYFRGLMSYGSCASGVLERKVAVCYSVMLEASVFVARAGISNGVGSIRDYIPLLHRALIDLGGFQLAILQAPSYGACAYTWPRPNVELRDFASSIAELGINMKFHAEARTQAKMPAAPIHNTGVALKQFGLALAKFSDSTYFCGRDLSGVVAANQPSLRLSSRIVESLTVEAISQAVIGERDQEGLPHLSELVSDYVQNFSPSKGSVTAIQRGRGKRR